MRFDIVTIFPDFFRDFLSFGILFRAIKKGILEVHIHNLRDYSTDKHKKIDDKPYGEESGMILMPEPLFRAVEAIKINDKSLTVLLSPQGKIFNQEYAIKLSGDSQIILICGRYEGVDERVREHLIDDEISIGDYILSGGEIPAMVIIDAVARLLPGVVGKEESLRKDSFFSKFLDHPRYTKPRDFRGLLVPEILLSGNHKEIRKWQKEKSIENTLKRRPDLIKKITLTEEEKSIIKKFKKEEQLNSEVEK
ncbi:MAG: tRNA (guanosine(37)-N1)-methyltransferase TrmD [Candidatus Aminicenantia bacterium]